MSKKRPFREHIEELIATGCCAVAQIGSKCGFFAHDFGSRNTLIIRSMISSNRERLQVRIRSVHSKLDVVCTRFYKNPDRIIDLIDAKQRVGESKMAVLKLSLTLKNGVLHTWRDHAAFKFQCDSPKTLIKLDFEDGVYVDSVERLTSSMRTMSVNSNFFRARAETQNGIRDSDFDSDSDNVLAKSEDDENDEKEEEEDEPDTGSEDENGDKDNMEVDDYDDLSSIADINGLDSQSQDRWSGPGAFYPETQMAQAIVDSPPPFYGDDEEDAPSTQMPTTTMPRKRPRFQNSDEEEENKRPSSSASVSSNSAAGWLDVLANEMSAMDDDDIESAPKRSKFDETMFQIPHGIGKMGDAEEAPITPQQRPRGSRRFRYDDDESEEEMSVEIVKAPVRKDLEVAYADSKQTRLVLRPSIPEDQLAAEIAKFIKQTNIHSVAKATFTITLSKEKTVSPPYALAYAVKAPQVLRKTPEAKMFLEWRQGNDAAVKIENGISVTLADLERDFGQPYISDDQQVELAKEWMAMDLAVVKKIVGSSFLEKGGPKSVNGLKTVRSEEEKIIRKAKPDVVFTREPPQGLPVPGAALNMTYENSSGYYLTAAIDFEKGQGIMQESTIVYVPDESVRCKSCDYCGYNAAPGLKKKPVKLAKDAVEFEHNDGAFKSSLKKSTSFQCRTCERVVFCSEECEQNGATLHMYECKIFASGMLETFMNDYGQQILNAFSKPNAPVELTKSIRKLIKTHVPPVVRSVRLLLRMATLHTNATVTARVAQTLQDSYAAYTPLFASFANYISSWVFAMFETTSFEGYPIQRPRLHELRHWHSQMFENAFGAFGDGTMVGSMIHGVSSFLNHSCEPNASWTHIFKRKSAPVFSVRAESQINAGETVTISYTKTEDVIKRRYELLMSYRFYCDCPKCVRQMQERIAEDAKIAEEKAATAIKETRKVINLVKDDDDDDDVSYNERAANRKRREVEEIADTAEEMLDAAARHLEQSVSLRRAKRKERDEFELLEESENTLSAPVIAAGLPVEFVADTISFATDVLNALRAISFDTASANTVEYQNLRLAITQFQTLRSANWLDDSFPNKIRTPSRGRKENAQESYEKRIAQLIAMFEEIVERAGDPTLFRV